MREKIIYVVTILITLTIGITGTIIVFHYFPFKKNVVEKTVKEVNLTETNTIKSAVDKIYDAVVLIEAYKGNRLFSSGTGFVYKKDNKLGYIMTNDHVIDGATKIKVTNSQGKEVEAKLLGGDEFADIAVLSVNKDDVLAVAELGDSTKLEIGDTLFTVGSPLGKEYAGTVTKGILSGKNRKISVQLTNGNFMMEVLQTDAAMNPGNSGGPLVNINGEVIGVNSLKLVEDEIEGMGFAIPIELAMASIDSLEKGEKIIRPVIGVELLDVTNTYALYMRDIYIKEDMSQGTVVINVAKDTPAEKAGFKKGDVILEVNGTKIKDSGHFRFVLYKYKVGDKIKIKYYRDGKINEIEVLLNKSLED